MMREEYSFLLNSNSLVPQRTLSGSTVSGSTEQAFTGLPANVLPQNQGCLGKIRTRRAQYNAMRCIILYQIILKLF